MMLQVILRTHSHTCQPLNFGSAFGLTTRIYAGIIREANRVSAARIRLREPFLRQQFTAAEPA